MEVREMELSEHYTKPVAGPLRGARGPVVRVTSARWQCKKSDSGHHIPVDKASMTPYSLRFPKEGWPSG